VVKKKSGILLELKKHSAVLWRRLFRQQQWAVNEIDQAAVANGNWDYQRNGASVATITSVEKKSAREGPDRQTPRMVPHLPNCGSRSYTRAKQVLDIFLAAIGLIVAAPVMALAMALVKLTSRGPALYSQTRVGLNGRPFTIYKIRSMSHKCESLTGACWSKPGDPRVTSLGKILRATHIDELPQLWNVLRGEMSLIGPRPERPEFVPQLEKAIPLYHGRLLVRPGVTGLAQIQLPPDTDLDSVRLKLAYDLYYVRKVGFWFDLRILLGTLLKLTHVPFAAIRKILRLQSQDAIQHEYQQLQEMES
jgi:lipopolysaccharide/colanic/teichoic acid biosynthesis glycosyltransferase